LGVFFFQIFAIKKNTTFFLLKKKSFTGKKITQKEKLKEKENIG